MSFHVGQKVVHVPIRNGPVLGNRDWPPEMTAGRIVTIRDVDTRYLPSYGVVGLRFEELHYPPFPDADHEPAFGSHQFRPVTEGKTDISIFTEMLTPKRKTLAPPPTHREVSAAQSSRHSPHKI